MGKIISLGLVILMVTGCASSHDPKLAWWVSQTPQNLQGKLPAVSSTGVNIQQIYVNGTGYQIVTPVR